MADRIVIADAEVISPIGFSAAETAASALARISRIHESGVLSPKGRAITVASVPEEGLPDLVEDPSLRSLAATPSRLIRLIDRPLRTIWGRLLENVGESAIRSASDLAIFLATAEPQQANATDSSMLLHGLSRQLQFAEPTAAGLALDAAISSAQVFSSGRAGGLEACLAAASAITEGKADFAIAGGVDSHLAIECLFSLCEQNRIRDDQQPDGFTPSEGAGFILLTRESVCQQRGIQPIAVFNSGACGFEPGHLGSEDPYLGDGLAQTITTTLQSADQRRPVGCIYSSFNGERYWARELGVSVIRNKDAFLDDHRMEHPAECLGDTGAAAGGVMIALAALGISKEKATTSTLIYASSDFGRRAAVLLQPI